MPQPCPITGVGHHWKLESYEQYISRGVCDCGAVGFFADVLAKDVQGRVELLNSKKGREGEQPSRAVAIALATRVENKKEEKAMVTPEERTNYERMSPPAKGKWLKKHMEELVADIKSMPKEEVLELWPFKETTYLKLKKKHAPELVGKRKPRPKPGKDKPPVPDQSLPPELTAHEQLIWHQGYRQGVKESHGTS